MRELRSALRSLLQRPGFFITIVLTLGLAVGVNTVIFSVVNAVLLRPLPYPAPDRLVALFTQRHSFQADRNAFSRPEFVELERDVRSFSSVSAWSLGTATFGDLAQPIRVSAAYTTANLAEMLGVAPALGRFFDRGEDVPGDPRVVVLAEVLFETRSVDPLVFALVSSLMLAIALLAAWVPARRALGVDPMVSLRSE